MPDRISIEIDTTKANDLLKQYDDDTVTRVERRAIKKVGKLIVKQAKSTTTFNDRTGFLRKSIRQKQYPRGPGSQILIGNKIAYYGHWIEYGTQKMRARKPIGTAVEQLNDFDGLANLVADEIEKELDILGR